VALKLFPELMHSYPELVELRDSTLQDARPVDYATQLGLRIGAPRVRAEMAKRGWSLAKSKAVPLNAGEDYQEIDLGYAAACLRQHGAFYLGWSRGLGKTLGTAALIDDLDLKSTLIIAPNSREVGDVGGRAGVGVPVARGPHAPQRRRQARQVPRARDVPPQGGRAVRAGRPLRGAWR
jgi:hypothetical protein